MKSLSHPKPLGQLARILSTLIVMLCLHAQADAIPVTFSSASGNRAASAMFGSDPSGNLVVTLTNTSTNDVLVPTEVLTAVFFDIQGDPTLIPLSAELNSGSTVLFPPSTPVATNVGGEWAYKSGLYHAPGGSWAGISSTGMGLFGHANFGGPNLQGPRYVDGLQYGITSAGDNPATGNNPVTGRYALIQNSVVFQLGGFGSLDPAAVISNVTFQYGTSSCDTSLPGHRVPDGGSTALMLGVGLMGMIWLRQRVRIQTA